MEFGSKREGVGEEMLKNLILDQIPSSSFKIFLSNDKNLQQPDSI
jgi:hypothetical protein